MNKVCKLVLFSFIGLLFCFSPYHTSASSSDDFQFVGTAQYPNCKGVPKVTSVIVYKAGIEIAKGWTFGDNGCYGIRGPDENFPSGTYKLYCDDGIGAFGYIYVYHEQGTCTEGCDIVLNQFYK